MKRTIRLLIFLCVLTSIGKGWYLAKDGFDLRRIRTSLTPSTCSSQLTEEIESILNQEYLYLGRGRQSFAFQSVNGQYVLKLPRIDRYQTRLWIRSFPMFEKKAEASKAHKTMRKNFVFNSFRIAFQELKEETGLLYLHLEKTSCLPVVTIRDRIGRSYKLCLDETAFLIQKKLPLGFPKLEEYLKEKNWKQAQELIEHFLDLAVLRAKKGIFNRDSNFFMNFAYDGKRFFQIDVGSFHKKNGLSMEMTFESSFLESTNQLKQWIHETDTEFCDWMEEKINDRLKERSCAI